MASTPQPYFASQNVDKSVPNLPLDAEWVRGSFLIPNDLLESSISATEALSQIYAANVSNVDTTNLNSLTGSPLLYYRYWSSAYLKFTNTQLGGNIGVNCKPQFTRYADIRIPGLIYNNPVTVPVIGKNGQLEPNSINIGMGRYYSEAIDDKAQRVYLRFGVPMFNTLANFLANAFNTDLSDLVNTGRGPSAFYYAGKAIGKVAMFITFPVFDTLLTGVEAAVRISQSMGFSTFYTMKPTMPLYWSAVNDLVNQMATYRGILPPAMLSNTYNNPLAAGGGTEEDIANYNKLLPTVFTAEGALNVYAMANRTQAMFEAARQALYKAEKGASASNLTLQSYTQTVTPAVTAMQAKTGISNLGDLINTYKNTIGTTAATPSSSTKTSTKKNPDPKVANTFSGIETLFYLGSADTKGNKISKKNSTNFITYMKAEAQAGGGYAVFVVDNTGSQSESFSNDVGQSQISSMLNNFSSEDRQIKYDFADGNIAFKPVTNAVKDIASFVQGAASSIHIGGLVNFIFGAGFIEIPKFWTGSSASLPRADYKFDLVSPYGNAVSQLQNIYLPLAMVMAGGLPLATGRQSYSSPFICQVFDRGKLQIQLGMIDGISITRGTTNLAYTQEWRMLGCTVTVSIVDMSNLMFMPLTSGTFFNTLAKGLTADAANALLGIVDKNTFVAGAIETGVGSLDLAATDQNNVLYTYLLTLTGADAQNALYYVSKAKLAIANNIKFGSELTSNAYIANKLYGWASGTWGVSILTRMYAGFNVNAEIQTAAQAASLQTLSSQNLISAGLG